jgi:sodium/proline symporter
LPDATGINSAARNALKSGRRRVNRQGAIAGIISGGITVFLWKFLVRPLGGVWDIYELLPAFIVSMIFIIVISLITPEPDREIYAEFDSVRQA